MTAIRGASGLGDSVYLRPIVEHFARAGRKPVALSNYPEIFAGADCTVEPFRRERVDVVAHYVMGKANPATTQFEDMVRAAGIAEPVPLSFDWHVQNPRLVRGVRANADGRPVVLVHGGRAPMARTDGFGKELLPEEDAFRALVAALPDCHRVGVGAIGEVYPIPVDEDLRGETTVSDLLDLFATCDGAVGQCSFVIPMAEVFDRPLLVLWARRGLACSNEYINRITPQKILHKPTSRFVIDDAGEDEIREAARAFRDAIRSR